MAKPTGFMEFERASAPKRSVSERLNDYREIEQRLDSDTVEIQASRCMDCGVPFCHAVGCPVQNRIPDINDFIYRKQWRKALALLHSTNNFPEITGRVCPALCEEACTLAVNKAAVSIRLLELHLVERGFREGWIVPEPAPRKTGRKVAVAGSGPAGLAAAQQLARRGHQVVVFEEAQKPGGLLRYGIPDFKLDKSVLDRRLLQMRGEGVIFETGVLAGEDVSLKYLTRNFDALILATGARAPRDLAVPGRDLPGIHFALDYLTQQNQRNSLETVPGEGIGAAGKRVLVIGGGDTGSDCIGTAHRQGARDVTQIELLPEPPTGRTTDNPWPDWPQILRTSTSHEEGAVRMWSLLTKSFTGGKDGVTSVRCVKLNWKRNADGKMVSEEIKGSEFEIKADLVLLATGFLHVNHDRMVRDGALALSLQGNLLVNREGLTSHPGIFGAGDSVRGPSLVVHAIAAGRSAAEAVQRYLLK
ncbi:MAG: glutamate synthase subunit beta [Fibrobacterota bacterium]